LNVISSEEYITVSLHACGDLSISTHEICLSSSKIPGAISVKCFYQHLTGQYFPLLPENQGVCNLLFGDNDEHRHNFLNYAVYQYDVDFFAHQELLLNFLKRSNIDCFIPHKTMIKKIRQ
jgi:hypothetical protein